jgi:hypothetical protein
LERDESAIIPPTRIDHCPFVSEHHFFSIREIFNLR